MSLNLEQRKSTIFNWLYNPENGQLRQYAMPEHYSNDRARTEINNMVADINSEITSQVTENYLAHLLEQTASGVRKNHTGRNWPTIRTFCKSVSAVQDNSWTSEEEGSSQAEYDRAVGWCRKFKDAPPPSISADTTDRLLHDNIITLSDAFKLSFPMHPQAHDRARSEFLGPNHIKKETKYSEASL